MNIIIIFSCVPLSVETPTADVDVYEDCEPCPLLLNFASSNYQNRDWRGAVDNYNQLLKCNCGQLDPENTFKYIENVKIINRDSTILLKFMEARKLLNEILICNVNMFLILPLNSYKHFNKT